MKRLLLLCVAVSCRQLPALVPPIQSLARCSRPLRAALDVELSDEVLARSLRQRHEELAKRPRQYVVRTQRGFLNVHREPGDPFRGDNVVARLYEGDVVTGFEEKEQSVLPRRVSQDGIDFWTCFNERLIDF